MTSDFSVAWQFSQREQFFLLRIKLHAYNLISQHWNWSITFFWDTSQFNSKSTPMTSALAKKRFPRRQRSGNFFIVAVPRFVPRWVGLLCDAIMINKASLNINCPIKCTLFNVPRKVTTALNFVDVARNEANSDIRKTDEIDGIRRYLVQQCWNREPKTVIIVKMGQYNLMARSRTWPLKELTLFKS
jgi:hypothetical protein